MSILNSLSKTFNPAASESARRRKDVFGTENKAIVGGLIVAGAAAAIAAPAAIAAGGLKKLGSAVAGSSLRTKVGLALAAPVALGAVSSDPKIVTRTAGGLVNFEKNLVLLGKDPTPSNFVNVFKENPVVATTFTAGVLLVSGGGGAVLNGLSSIETRRNTEAVRENTASGNSPVYLPTAPNQSAPSMIPLAVPNQSKPSVISPDVPLTPETQAITREVKSKSKSVRKSVRKGSVPVRNSVRVNVINQNKYISRSSQRYYE